MSTRPDVAQAAPPSLGCKCAGALFLAPWIQIWRYITWPDHVAYSHDRHPLRSSLRCVTGISGLFTWSHFFCLHCFPQCGGRPDTWPCHATRYAGPAANENAPSCPRDTHRPMGELGLGLVTLCWLARLAAHKRLINWDRGHSFRANLENTHI